jgi:iron complex outermembrane recepter protein
MRRASICGTTRKNSSVSSTPRGVLLLLCLMLAAGRTNATDPDRSITLEIAAGTSLERALIDLAQEAQLSFSARTSVLAGYETPALKGTFPLHKALSLLLRDTGLSYTVVAGTVFVSTAEPVAHRPIRSRKVTRRRMTSERTVEGDHAMSEVRIQGIHIPDSPLGSPDLVFDRGYLKGGGFQTLGELLRSLPQSFGGGLNPGVIAAGGRQNTLSLSGASSANLRGLGSASTLTLINGQRLATAEGSGAVDVTLIPISAVERVEVTSGGASALYGSDAVAGVVNIILRTAFEGIQVSGAAGDATEGGGSLQHYSLMGGHAWNDTNAFALQDCAWQSAVESGQRSYVPAALAGTTLLPKMQHCSTVFSARRELPGDIDASLLGIYTRRSSYQAETLNSSPTPLAEAIQAAVEQYAVNATFTVPLGDDWVSLLSAGVSADNVSAPQRVTIASVPYKQGNRVDNRLGFVEADVDGTLLELPSGPLQLALGAGSNVEEFVFTNLPTGGVSLAAQRRVSFVFAEAAIPLIGETSDERDVTPLTLDIAGRAEQYSDIGWTANPKIGLLYTPAPDFKVSASWGTSFRAPSLLEQYTPSTSILEVIPDLTAPRGQSLALFRFGGNPRLQPEESTDSTVGLKFTPSALPDASLQVNYYNIVYQRRIEYPTANTGNPLSDLTVAPFIERNPSAAQIGQILVQSPLEDLTGGLYSPLQAALVIDDHNQNISRQRASGIDLLANYSLDTPIGRLDSSLNVAYLDLQQQTTTMSPVVPVSGTVFYPPAWRSRVGVQWNYGTYLGSIFVNYTGPSRNTAMVAPELIASWTTVDARVGYRLPRDGQWGNTQLALRVTNVLDRRPPFADLGQAGWGDVNYDWTNASPVGRHVMMQITVDW